MQFIYNDINQDYKTLCDVYLYTALDLVLFAREDEKVAKCILMPNCVRLESPVVVHVGMLHLLALCLR